MSLINDALKKAQKQRTGEAPSLGSLPSVGGESPHRIAKRAKPAGFDTMMLRAGIGGAVVLVLAIGGFFLLREKPETGNLKPESGEISPAAPGGPVSLPADAKESAGQTPGSQQGTTVPASVPPAPTFTLPAAPKAEDRSQASDVSSGNGGGTLRPDAGGPVSAPAATSAASSAPISSPATQQPATNNQQPAPVAERPKLEPRAIEFIENIKVAGIRASATDAKVLMNDRVYRPGSLVSAEFRLRLVEIASDSLTFEDEKGGRYTRTF